MICAATSQFLSARGPVEYELAMDYAATKPVGSHVHRIGAIGDNGVAGDSHGGGIVGLGGRMTLGKFHFVESLV